LLLTAGARAEDPPPTDPPPTEPTPPAPPPVDSGSKTIQFGVKIAGQDVGGLTAREAVVAVQRHFDRSIQLVVSKTWKKRFTPAQLGARARVGKAVESALRARSVDAAIPLTVDIDAARLHGVLAKLGRDTARAPVDSKLRLIHLAPTGTKSVEGRRLEELKAFYALTLTLRKHVRDPFALPFQLIEPKLTEDSLGKAIVIRRGSNELLLYNDSKLKREFHVATGASSYPTPLGRYAIVNKQRNPWWYPPQGSAWAKGEQPVPPGPGNPLGTRWMGLSAPLVGIHGTPNAASIGYSASHGCIRMLIPQAEWLFEHVDIGTPVFIVPA